MRFPVEKGGSKNGKPCLSASIFHFPKGDPRVLDFPPSPLPANYYRAASVRPEIAAWWTGQAILALGFEMGKIESAMDGLGGVGSGRLTLGSLASAAGIFLQ